MKRITKIVLDTSIFVNPDSRYFFGKKPHDALSNFLDTLEEKKHLTCYIPPSVYEELMKFMEKPLSPKKTILINKKGPASYQTAIPSLFLYEFIEEMRLRTNKGLRIAEKYARKGLVPSKDKHHDSIIKTLRDEYRTALREGIIDSKEDFDLILLAYELGAYLATSDNGLIKWAQKLGISCLNAEELKEILNQP
ncbi:MAG: RNA ligase partner protein [Candidatus Omnitrophota bacterium]|nr:MAG: RNA ligase partner protein [Candidatus Omnitrophota bacterium]